MKTSISYHKGRYVPTSRTKRRLRQLRLKYMPHQKMLPFVSLQVSKDLNRVPMNICATQHVGFGSTLSMEYSKRANWEGEHLRTNITLKLSNCPFGDKTCIKNSGIKLGSLITTVNITAIQNCILLVRKGKRRKSLQPSKHNLSVSLV